MPLPHTEVEAGHVAKLFRPERRAVFLSSNATRDNLLSAEVRNARILHIATHGYAAAEVPDIVGLALSPSGPAGNRYEGFVPLTDIRGPASGRWRRSARRRVQVRVRG